MGISRYTTQQANAVGNTTLNINKPSGAVAGDLLVAFVIATGSGTVTSPAGWTEIFNVANGTSYRCVVAWKVLTSGDNGVLFYGWTSATTRTWAGQIQGRSGTDAVSPIDASSNSSSGTTTTSYVSASVTTTKANGELLNFAATFFGSGIVYTAPGGMTEDLQVTGGAGAGGVSFESAYKDLGAIGATGNQTVTGSKSSIYSAFQVALKAGTSNFTQALTATSSSTPTIRRASSRTFSASSSTLASIARAMVKTISTNSSNLASFVKQTTKSLFKSSLQTAFAQPSFLRFLALTATSSTSASISKALIYGRTLVVSSTTSVSIQRAVAKILSVTKSQSATRSLQVSKTLSKASSQLSSLVKNNVFKRTLSVASSSAVTLTFQTLRGVKFILGYLLRKTSVTSRLTKTNPQSVIEPQHQTSRITK